jgi:hypothetical protein
MLRHGGQFFGDSVTSVAPGFLRLFHGVALQIADVTAVVQYHAGQFAMLGRALAVCIRLDSAKVESFQ